MYPKRRYNLVKKDNTKVKLIFTLLVITLLVILLGYFLYRRNGSSNVIKDIRKKTNFPVAYQAEQSEWKLDDDSVAYDKEENVLIYRLSTTDSTILISQQPVNDGFNEKSKDFQRMLDQLVVIDEIGSDIGTVYVTKPFDYNNDHTAILLYENIIIYARSSGELNNNQWLNFFNNLRMIK